MKTPRLKAFKAWVSVDDSGVGNWWLCDTRQLCLDYCAANQRPVRVVVRDARDDSEARLKRENARLRRAMRRALGLLHRSAWESNRDMARGVLDAALERRDRR